MSVVKINIILGFIVFTMLLVLKAYSTQIGDYPQQIETQELLRNIQEKYQDLTPISSDIGVLGDKDNQFSPSPFADSVMFYADEEYLYCIYIAQVDSSLERGRVVKKDGDTQSDAIAFTLITQPNQFFAYGFEASPLGVLSDYTLDTSFNADWSWNSDSRLTSTLSDNNWLVELRIPWCDLRMGSKAPYTLGVYVSRFCYQGKKSYRYPYVQYTSGPFFFQNGAQIIINNPIGKQGNFKADAYYVAIYDSKENRGNIWYKNIGGNLNIKPYSNASFKISIKPDFSDTPLDSAVDNYNSKNPPQIAENRSFFLEDYDLLAVSSDLWYTRNIISPIFAGKYTRVSQDRAVALVFLRDDPSNNLSNGDFFNALGYSRTFATSKVNINLYGRQNDDFHNELAHASFSYRPLEPLEILPIVNFSYMKQDSLSSMGYDAGITLTNTHSDYTFWVASELTDTNFRADMGSFYNQDRFQNTVGFFYDKPRNGFLSRLQSNVQWQLDNTLSSGELMSSSGNYSQLVYLDNNNYAIAMETYYRAEKFQSQLYHPYKATLGLNWLKNSRLTAFASVSGGKEIVYSLSEILPVIDYYGVIQINLLEKLWIYYNLTYVRYSHSKLDYWDPEYNLMNLINNIVLQKNIILSQGLSLTNYNITMKPDMEYLGNLGYYLNLDWNVGSNSHIYAGYKSQYSHYSIQSDNDLITDASNFYLKIQLGF